MRSGTASPSAMCPHRCSIIAVVLLKSAPASDAAKVAGFLVGEHLDVAVVAKPGVAHGRIMAACRGGLCVFKEYLEAPGVFE